MTPSRRDISEQYCLGETGFTVSPDGKVLVYSKPAQTVSDLYLVEGVR